MIPVRHADDHRIDLRRSDEFFDRAIYMRDAELLRPAPGQLHVDVRDGDDGTLLRQSLELLDMDGSDIARTYYT
jgi:hypothetical protein